MSINTIIEEQKKSLLNLILEEYDLDSEQVWDWHIQSIIQILEAEVERLKGIEGDYELAYYECLDDQITHLTNIIKEIK